MPSHVFDHCPGHERLHVRVFGVAGWRLKNFSVGARELHLPKAHHHRVISFPGRHANRKIPKIGRGPDGRFVFFGFDHR